MTEEYQFSEAYKRLYPEIVTKTVKLLVLDGPLAGVPPNEIGIMLEHIIVGMTMHMVPAGREQAFIKMLAANVLDLLSVVRERNPPLKQE